MKRGQAEFGVLLVVLILFMVGTIVIVVMEQKQKGDREHEAHEERMAQIRRDGGTP